LGRGTADRTPAGTRSSRAALEAPPVDARVGETIRLYTMHLVKNAGANRRDAEARIAALTQYETVAPLSMNPPRRRHLHRRMRKMPMAYR